MIADGNDDTDDIQYVTEDGLQATKCWVLVLVESLKLWRQDCYVNLYVMD